MLDVLDLEAISALAGSRPYRLLMELLQDGINEILAQMYKAKTDAEVLKLARIWQVYFHYWSILENRPQEIKANLERDLEEIRQSASQYSTVDPMAPPFDPSRAALLAQIERSAGMQPHKQFELDLEGNNK